ncbi:alcohol dehydrogenase class IV [Marinobacterium sp. MBR-109]|jgi:alcohol dehydrogenase
MAMMSVNMSGGLYAHSVSYILGMHKPTPHGLGCALGLPYLMYFNISFAATKLAKIARIMGESTTQLTDESAALKAVSSVARLMLDIKIPLTLKQYGIDENDLEAMALDTIKLFPRPFNPRTMGNDESIEYWRTMYEGLEIFE